MELISVIVLICSVEAGEIVRETCEAQAPRLWYQSMGQCDKINHEAIIEYLLDVGDPNLRVEYYCHDWLAGKRQNEAL